MKWPKICPWCSPFTPGPRPALAPWDESHGLFLVEPQVYLSFLNLEASVRLVLTSSGGIQEDTTALGRTGRTGSGAQPLAAYLDSERDPIDNRHLIHLVPC